MRLDHGLLRCTLLVGAPLGACGLESPTETDGGPSGTTEATGGLTETGTGTGEATGTPDSTSTGTATGSDETTGTQTGPETSSTTSGTSEGPGSESTTGEPTQACIDSCAVEVECGRFWSSIEECETWCEANLVEAGYFSTYCQDAWEGLHACIGGLTCEQYEAYLAGGNAFPCDAAFYTLDLECEGQ